LAGAVGLLLSYLLIPPAQYTPRSVPGERLATMRDGELRNREA
jgi:hypothetical protein